MKRILWPLISLLLMFKCESATSVLASYDFSEGLGPTTLSHGITATHVSVTGANLIFPTLYDGNPSPAVAARFWLGGRDNGRYYSFAITNTLATAVLVNGIQMELRNESPGTGPTGFALMSSAEGFLLDLANGSLDWTTRAWVNVDTGMNTLLPSGETLEFRVTGWGANSIPPQGGHLIMDNIVVTTVPEPSVFALMGLAAVIVRRRCRRPEIVKGGSQEVASSSATAR